MVIRNLLVSLSFCFLAQFSGFSQGNYTLINDASTLPGCHCYQLTPNTNNQGGGVYQNNTINLNNSFDYKFNVFLGCNGASGADGIVFILTNNITGIGAQGGGLGYSGLSGNSLACEFDTWQNSQDPPYDHIAFESGGSVNHNVAGPVPALVSQSNIDNCQWHTVEIIWDVNTQTYSVYFDGVLRLSYTGNIVTNFFGGNPIVNWGWSGSTGGGHNLQQFCVQSTSDWVAGINYQSCNLTMQFTDISTSNVATVQSWAWKFGDPSTGANNSSALQNPTHTFSAAGTYTVTLIITDISGCPDTFSHIVTIAPPITLTPTITNPLCNGNSTGDISLVPAGGFGPSAGYGGYQYTWSTGGTGPTDVGLTAGTYNVTVTDGVCTSSASYTISQPPPLTATTSHTDAPCAGTGTATITISGGTPGYTGVVWDNIAGSPGPSTFTSTGLPVGVVVANFHDANGCSALLTYKETINSLPCGYTLSTSSTNVTCFGGSNGSVTLTVTGSIGAVTITWTNAGGTTVGSGATVSGLPAGTYTYHYSDASNAFVGPVVVNQPGGAMTASLSTINTTCSYLNNGSAVASVTANGAPNYSYSWSAAGQTNSPTATGLSPGPITVTITDNNNCTTTATGTITSQPVLSASVTTTPDSCFQNSTGTATVAAVGGTPNYTYLWSNSSTSVGSSIYNVNSGAYTVTVSDHNSCTATASGTISQPPLLTATLTDSNIACFGGASGTATIVAAGGNGGYTYSWSNSSTAATISSLPPNKYYVTVTDSKLCSVVDSVNITQPPSAFTVTPAHVNVKCKGMATGSITLTLAGGSTPYGTVNWNGGATGTTRTNLLAGTYTYTVMDAHDCSVTGSITITEPASVFTVTPTQVNVLCFGNSTGSITLTQAGGTTPYATSQWLDGFIGNIRNNLAAGTYSYGDSDNNGCVVTGSITITQPASAFAVAVAQTNVLCHGGTTGSITLTLSGGTTPYGTVNWRDGATGTSRTNLTAGNYSYIATDGNGCVDSATVTITQPAAAFAVTATQVNVKCKGMATGSITLTLAGGTTPYGTVNWNGGATGTTRTNLLAGTYTYTVLDANNCSVTGSITITEPASVFTVTPTQVNVLCFGNSTGSITLTQAGGTTPYATSQWLDGFIGNIRNNLAAGTYSYGDSDNNGCVVTGSITITQPASAFAVAVAQTNVLCHGGTTGSITLTLSGGTTPYGTVNWRDGATGTSRTNLTAGNYSYIATDGNGCIDSATITITQPAAAFAVTATQVNVKCKGMPTGSITLTLSGGTTPYGTVTWTDGPTGTTRTNLVAGTYTYNVSDANGCPATGSVTITEPATAFTITPAQVNVLCFGASTGSITLTPAGGTTPYATAEWLDGFIGDVRNNLAAGTYSYGDSDNNGCVVTGSITITQPASAFAVAVAQTNVLCNGGTSGSITLTLSGGTTPYGTVNWRDGATGLSRTNLAAGNYSYIATDGNGCVDSATVTITEPTPIVPVIASLDSISCFGANDGSVVVTATGGTNALTFELDASGTFQNNGAFTGLTPGSHTVTVQDANNCTATITFNTYEPPLVTSSILTTVNDSCFGQCNGLIVASAAGGTPPYEYSIDGVNFSGSGTFNSLCANPSYTINVKDKNGCPSNVAGSITQPTAVVVSPVDSFPPTCNNGPDASFDVTAAGGAATGYTYSLNGGPYTANGGHFTGVTPGTYTVTAQDANGCTGAYTITVPNVAATSSFTTSVVEDSCFGASDGSITVTVTGTLTPYSFSWSNGANSQNLTSIPVGTYTVRVTDVNGCIVYGPDSTNTITQPTAVTATNVMTPVTCFGDSNGCITVTPAGGTPPYLNSWTTGATTNNPCGFKAGSYSDTITDSYGCQYIYANIAVTQPTAVSVTLDSVTLVSCAGDSNGVIYLTSSGGTPGYTYLWSQGGTSDPQGGLKVGTYAVTVSDSHNCTVTDSVTVGVNNPITFNATKSNVLCPPLHNGSISLTVSGGAPSYQYAWSNGETTNAVYNLPVGIDSVTVTDSRGCAVDTGFVITNDSAFSIKAIPDTATINEGDMIQLGLQIRDVGAGSYTNSIVWSPAEGLSCSDCVAPQATPFNTTLYTIEVTTDSGCVSNTQTLITVIPQHQLYVPNAFTPNNDGVNDYWEAFGNKKTWIFCEVQVYDRWGEKIYESNDINFKWDGKYRGTFVEPGEYVYVFKVVFVDDYSVTNKGSITVIR